MKPETQSKKGRFPVEGVEFKNGMVKIDPKRRTFSVERAYQMPAGGINTVPGLAISAGNEYNAAAHTCNNTVPGLAMSAGEEGRVGRLLL